VRGGRWPVWVKVACAVLPLTYGAYLGWNEWALRTALLQPGAQAPALAEAPPRAPVNPSAIVTVMGLAAPQEGVRSAEPLTLRASFVSSTGHSRALLAGSDGERLYRVGERLPGGSVLRRVEIDQVVLWRQGREELLPLHVTGSRMLQPATTQTHAAAPVPNPSFLRPAAEPLQSD